MTIKQKQWQLYYLGFLDSRDEIDGIVGPITNKAIEAFKNVFGIDVNGVSDDRIWNKSKEIITIIQDSLKKYTGINLVIDGLAGPTTCDVTAKYHQMMGMPTADFVKVVDKPKIMEFVNVNVSTGVVDKVPESTAGITGTFWDEIKHFKREEFKCKCGGKYCNGYPAEPKEAMVRIADQLRTNLGVPITIVSGLRCQRWNAIQGGVANSQHMYGEAADIYAKGKSQSTVEAELDRIGGVRYHYPIAGSSNVHFDVPKGSK